MPVFAPLSAPGARQLETGDKAAQLALADALVSRIAIIRDLHVTSTVDVLLVDHLLANLGRYHYFDRLALTLMVADPIRHLDQVERFERLSRRAEAAFLRTLEVLTARTRPAPRIAVTTAGI